MAANPTAEIRLKLPRELKDKLAAQAEREHKALSQLILETIENYLHRQELSSLDFVGAWADSDIYPEDILARRTLGRNIEL